jgi:hypothetical protein
MRTIEEQASDANLYRLGRHSVAIVNGIRVYGVDPITGRRADGEEVGTGCAGRWSNHYFILTARHVIETAQPHDLRFYCLPTGGVECRSASDLRPQDIVDAEPLADDAAMIYRCGWEDLALITTTPNTIPNAEFFDAMNEWIDPLEGEPLHCCGFPFDHNVMVEQKIVGNKEERTIALYPTAFNATVLPLPSEDELKFKFGGFDANRHYLMPYGNAGSKQPHGISGAAMWWESDQKLLVWRPNFKFAGICTDCYKSGSVVHVVKASIVRRFLEEVFGPEG